MIDSLHATLTPGSGLVARFPHAVLLVASTASETTGRVVSTVRAATDHEERPGTALARRLAELVLDDEAGSLPPFGVVADAPEGVVVFVRGAVTAEIAGDQPVTLDGRDAATWVDRIVGGQVSGVSLHASGEEAESSSDLYALERGVVPAAAVGLSTSQSGGSAPPRAATPSAAPPEPGADIGSGPDDETGEVGTDTPPPPPPPPGEEPPAEVATGAEFPTIGPDASSDVEDRAPLTATGPHEATGAGLAAEAGTDAEAVMVQGIVCSRHHLNNPDANYCSVCGVSMVHVTHNLVTGPRPPLGFLVLDDGSTFTLDHDYVLGREPEAAERGATRSITLDDPERTISRVHAEVRLEGWDVRLVDRGSSNGSFLWDDTAQEWQRLQPDTPVTIQPGSHVALGQRTFRYETPHSPS